MPAYMIVLAQISDRERFIAEYGVAAGELVEKYGGRYVLRGPGAELLEGDFGDSASMVISEWPDKKAAMAFWNSREYAEIRKLRQDISECQVVLIESEKING
ncbi:DUF1330 domain-containing protein [Alterisphingorhabdus coralli]|uniref:DUF1330 domain-containing protein n=1 Tax=Alterisphingorhabdus coralli TaxID=3071408 RepID=A0AA97F8T8_9SPHN|nr:DUF1330 domain-containing protein [Parasphingorhabdus sp. SCSIO 66989]WOE75397.1 DUF1330 domain-containing protein [Parasphingorhabdus sp. SCSIO 66989]